MTAIFAYSSPTVAFVASDTLRSMPCNFLPPATVRKAHLWSDQVVFAQAGTQHQSKMIAEIQLRKMKWTDQVTGSVQFDDSEDWLFKTFELCQPSAYQNALRKNGATLSSGNLLVAYVNTCAIGNGIARYDFATGSRTIVTGQVAADGTDPVAFLKIANKHLSAMSVLHGTLRLDEWARTCLNEAIALHPTTVGWPADLIISKPDNHGGRLIVQRQINASSAVGDTIFLA